MLIKYLVIFLYLKILKVILRNLLKAQNEAIKKAQKEAALHDETEILVQSML